MGRAGGRRFAPPFIAAPKPGGIVREEGKSTGRP